MLSACLVPFPISEALDGQNVPLVHVLFIPRPISGPAPSIVSGHVFGIRIFVAAFQRDCGTEAFPTHRQ